jgi:hypothetical protein
MRSNDASIAYRNATVMTVPLMQRTLRHKQRTVVTGTEPAQVVFVIAAALAIPALMALDFLS